MKIKKITIKGFRGFNEEQSILLNSNVVLIYGLNGSGKSSFTEALEWLFFNEISRQRLSRCKSEYQYEEYLKNLFYNSSDAPFVEVEGEIKGVPVTIRKEIIQNSAKIFIDGKEKPDLKSLNLNLEDYFRPMLAQTEIKALVDSGQQDRWEQLSSILGQDDLTRLRDDLLKLRTGKKDDDFKRQEEKWKSIISDVLEIDSLISFEKPIRELDNNAVIVELNKITGCTSKIFNDVLIEIRTKQKNLLNTELGKRVTEISFKDITELKKDLDVIEKGFKKLEDEAIKSTYGGHDHNFLDFLKTGKEFAKLPECPFCLEKTLTSKRITDIEKLLEQGREATEAISQFKECKNNIDGQIRSYSQHIREYLPSQQELKIISQKFLDINEEKLASLVQELDKKITELISKICSAATKLNEEQQAYIETKFFHNQKTEYNPKEQIKIFSKDIITEIEIVHNEWNNTKEKITEKIPLTGQLNQEELKKWLILEKVCSFFTNANDFVRQTFLFKKIDDLVVKLEKYEKAEVTRLLNEHAQEIKNYYEKLNPSDPIQFSGIDVRGGVRRQAKLKAAAFGKDINPVTFFSEAHTNSLALSIYFPQRVDRNTTWETVILDDPVQSMDDNHSQALIEILVNIALKKQVIILTHSKSFFKRLCARFGYLKPSVYLFCYNEDRGPLIQLDLGETLSHLTMVEENCKKGTTYSLETAAQQLRKAIESICFEFLLDKGDSFSKAEKVQKSGLDSLFVEVERLGLPSSEVAKLKSLLDTSHSDSHAWSIANTSAGNLRVGIKLIEGIFNTYLK